MCYRCQQPGHISQGCRNQRVTVENNRDEQSKSKRDEVGKPQRDTQASENMSQERNNRSVRQTRFEERPEDVHGSSDDSSGELGTEARTNSIAIEVNAMIPREERIEKCPQRAPLVDMKTPEIAFKVKINCRFIKAILDTFALRQIKVVFVRKESSGGNFGRMRRKTGAR